MNERRLLLRITGAFATLAVAAASAGCASDDHFRCDPDGGDPLCFDDQTCTPRGYCANLCVRDGGPDDWVCAEYETCDPKLGYCVPRAGSGTADGGTSTDAGSTDAGGTSDGGTSDGGTSDGGTSNGSCTNNGECQDGICVLGTCRTVTSASLNSSSLGNRDPLRVALLYTPSGATLVVETGQHGLYEWRPSSIPAVTTAIVDNYSSIVFPYPSLTIQNGTRVLAYVNKDQQFIVYDLDKPTSTPYFPGTTISGASIEGTYLAALTLNNEILYVDLNNNDPAVTLANDAALHSKSQYAGLSIARTGSDYHAAYVTTTGTLGFASSNNNLDVQPSVGKPVSRPQLASTPSGDTLVLGFLEDPDGTAKSLAIRILGLSTTQQTPAWKDILSGGDQMDLGPASWPAIAIEPVSGLVHFALRIYAGTSCTVEWFVPDVNTGSMAPVPVATCADKEPADPEISLEIDSQGLAHIAFIDLDPNENPVVRYISVD
jgi:hypothetical protein